MDVKPYRTIETDNREDWLRSREGVLTATQIARLVMGGPGEWLAVRREFEGERRDFDSKYFAWGREREPAIAEYSRLFVDSSLEPNHNFLVSTRDPRIGATPDAIGTDVIGEFKTSKHPMPDDLSQAMDKLHMRYYVQVQVQLFVTGAEACVFAWEQHNDEWPSPEPYEIRHQIILPDKEMWGIIAETVDRFFEEDVDVDEVSRTVIQDKVDELREIQEQQDNLKQQESKIREQIQELLGDDDVSLELDGAKVTSYQPKPSKRFDSAEFKKVHPDMYQEFVKAGSQRERTLRITFNKED